MIYAGIGSRETPLSVLNIMESFARYMARNNHILRSGGAKGADSAFIKGADGKCEIYLPTLVEKKALKLAEQYHPAWNKCSDYAKKLHARNCYIILGLNLDHPVDFTVCYTKNGNGSGGTGQAIRICNAYNIKVIDLGKFTTDDERIEKLKQYVQFKIKK